MLRERTDEQSGPAAPARPSGVRLRPRRSPRLIALGVLCVVLGALGAAWLYSSNVDQRSVVIMTRDVPRGQEIVQEDLTVVSISSGFPVTGTDANALNDVVGNTALTDLPNGSFPAPSHFGEDPIPDGHSLVGLQLGPGRMPGTALPTGTQVQLVSLAEGDLSVTDAVVAEAPVLTDDGTGFVIDVVVHEDRAHQVARLAAGEQLALVAIGDS